MPKHKYNYPEKDSIAKEVIGCNYYELDEWQQSIIDDGYQSLHDIAMSINSKTKKHNGTKHS